MAEALQDWLRRVGIKSICIYPGSPLENGYIEGFNARLRDELLNGEIFQSLREAQILIVQWRRHNNTVRHRSALGYRPLAPERHHPVGPEGSDAATLKPDRSVGADQGRLSFRGAK